LSVVVEFNKVVKDYPGVKALNFLTFEVSQGEIHGLLGPNGAGKSTALQLIASLIKPNSGEIIIKGSIGFLPEKLPLYSHMLVHEQLSFVFGLYQKKYGLTQENLKKAIQQLKIEELLKKNTMELSKGQKQKVALAQVLMTGPDILVLDEPTSGLDPLAMIEFRELLKRLKGEHTIILSTHLLGEVENLCESVTLIQRGSAVASKGISEFKRDWLGGDQYHAIFTRKTTLDLEALEIKFADLDFENIEEKLFIRGLACDDEVGELSRFLALKYSLLHFSKVELDLGHALKKAMGAQA